MALPGPGNPLSISQIRSILNTSNGSLRYLSSLAGFSTPDAISEFYGYSPGYPRTLYWGNDSYSYGFGINLFISLNNNATILVNDTRYDYSSNSGSAGYTTGDEILFINEGTTGGNYAYQILQVYDASLGYYIVNQSGVSTDPYFYQSINTTTSNGTLDVTSSIEIW